MRVSLIPVIVAGMLAGCSAQPGAAPAPGAQPAAVAAGSGGFPARTLAARPASAIASLPDHGALLAYDRAGSALARGAYTWHPVQLSEAHALRAVADGELVLRAPDGHAIRLRYEHHVEHPDGNWTWVGREPGAMPGTEAIITFGEKAVFGSIPNGDKPPLRLQMAAGRTWLVETDPAAAARLHGSRDRQAPDFLVPPRLANRPTRALAAPATTATATTATATTASSIVDLVIGYTSGFASRLGGRSETMTRLNFMVDVANQAYANSQVDARLRLVHALQVDYADATSNDDALYEVTGVECTESGGGLSCEYVGPPASLQPLHEAREEFGGDLVSLVRKFTDPENGSCGVAWINGGGQQGMSHDSEITGFSVVSDSSGNEFPDGDFVCADESLAHELGHNMGSAHDRDTADGDDNTLQQNEYGAYAYSFGYKNFGAGFYTVMAYGDEGQSIYRVFSNPAIDYCGGFACGVANQADNARSLRQAIPVVAGFRAGTLPTGEAAFDFNGDGVSDVLWRHASTGANTIWLSARKATQQPMTRVANLAWRMVGVGDIDGDGRADVVWRNSSTGANTIWRSGNAATTRAMGGVASQAWKVVGVGDFNGDGQDDVLWRHGSTGANTIWKSANKSNQQAMTTITNLNWQVVGVGDFNGDGRDDVLWRHATSGANSVWYSGNYATRKNLTTVRNLAWRVFGVGDFNGDGVDDILWRNISTGADTIWKSANAATVQSMSGVANLAWEIEGVGDFDGNGVDDVLWRNKSTGANTVWLQARSGTKLAMSPVGSQAWQIQP